MIGYVYTKVIDELKKKPVRFWGITLFFGLIGALASAFCVLPIIHLPVAYVFEATLAMVFLTKYRTGDEPRCKDAFKHFNKDEFLHIAGGVAWKNLWVLIWALIPIVGPIFAVIRSYEYDFVPYILIDMPEVDATDAKDKSREMTYGYKGKIFLADLLLVAGFMAINIVFSLLIRITIRIRALMGLITFLLFITNTLYMLVLPLAKGFVHAIFYEEVSTMTEEKYMAMTRPVRPVKTPPQQQYQAYQPQQPQQSQQPQQQFQAYQPQQQAAPAVKICANCGSTIDANAKFCPKCGTKC